MPKTKNKKDRIPADVREAIEEAAADLAAETNLTKAEAEERIMARLNAKADAADVKDAADDIEDEEDERDEESSEDEDRKPRKKSKSKSKDEDEDEDEDSEDEDSEDGNEKDEKPPPSHWSSRPLFGKRK